ncbi:MAG: type 12 methyltransferase [archaeon GW2011_AR9]|nr:MAG: type 12 methyltransferase [archaeon GW2011_AR9]
MEWTAEEAIGMKEHWERIYQEKESQALSWYQEKPETSLRLIAVATLDMNAGIIDVGAGDSTLVDNLFALGFTNITALDVSSMALQRAKNRMGSETDAVKWVVADVRELETNERYQLWHDRAVLHFLTKEEDRYKYAERVRRFLKPGGFLIVAAFSPKGPTKCSGLEIRQYSEDSLKELFSDFEHIQSFEEEHLTPWGSSQNFLYSMFRKKEGRE